jgi:hypothetical protein
VISYCEKYGKDGVVFFWGQRVGTDPVGGNIGVNQILRPEVALASETESQQQAS